MEALSSLVLSSVSVGVSSFGAYTLGVLSGILNPIPAVDALVGQVLSFL